MDSLSIAKKHCYIVSVFIVACLYAQVYHFDYVWDDAILMGKENIQASATWLSDIFLSPFFVSDGYYRPLPYFTMVAQMKLHGFNESPAHIFSLFIHLGNMILLAWILRRTLSQRKLLHQSAIIALTTFIYGIHPTLIETTAWVSGRFDLMLVFFTLLCFALDMSLLNKKLKPLLIGLSFFLAALCKETAIGIAMIFPLWHLLKSAHQQTDHQQTAYKIWFSQREHLNIYFSLVLFGLIYLLLRYVALGDLIVSNTSLTIVELTAIPRYVFVLSAIAMYTEQLFLPLFNLSPIHSAFELEKGDLYIGLFITVITLLLLATRIVPKGIKITLIAFFISLLPVIHLLPIHIDESIIHNRFLAFPLATLIIFASLALQQITWKISMSWLLSSVLSLALLLWVFALFMTSYSSITFWKDSASLWSWAYSQSNAEIVRVHYGEVLSEQGQLQASNEVLDSITAEDRLYIYSASIKAKNLYRMGKYDKAETLFVQIIPSLDKNNKITMNIYRANMAMDQKKYAKAKAILLKNASLQESYTLTWQLLCRIYSLHITQPALATEACRKAIKYALSENNRQQIIQSFKQDGISIPDA